ncbi:hypothetical protein KIW84_022733 [Lathyrus oleraceus]|uniref:Integrator complex subunit 7 N-terminal domain-containing protein n=1 Tax=Pisum sativum TaxID=3888 RepID=A0A9D4YDU6_PEA|nr:hypothetical protein KIW84_022733 [Pisum sativum]
MLTFGGDSAMAASLQWALFVGFQSSPPLIATRFSCNLEVVDAAFEDEDEHEAQHMPAGIDSGPGYLLQVVSRFDLALNLVGPPTETQADTCLEQMVFSSSDTEGRLSLAADNVPEAAADKSLQAIAAECVVGRSISILTLVLQHVHCGMHSAGALVLFGCWADFANDNAQIRYLILSSLVSPHDCEVKASLFAAGCFCEISDDFACITLEILFNIMNSPAASLPIKLAAARIFAKFKCSYSVAKKAYKIGLELISNSLNEDILVIMLFSISKLASISTLLTSNLVRVFFIIL